ncbi:MAG: hypothetical protein M1457_12970 [bacterium]|nr:hypothetical protein [bacterium]
MIIRITQHTIESLDASGQIVKRGRAGTDDATIIQDAIDRLRETMGGQVLLRAGKYVLSQPIQVNLPVSIVGEGRATEIKPPKGDFAFKVHHDGRSLERHYASFREPPAHFEKVPGWESKGIAKAWMEGRGTGRPRLWGVLIRHLAIQGDGQGKGIFLSWLTESAFRDLWINNCADGAALFLEQQVMECVFDNLHLSNCGSPANKEATITIRSEAGDPCNNLWFRSIYVIFPQYIGIEIGSVEHENHPRLIWFEDSMIHGWHVLVDPAPYDLIRINRTDPSRGICFKGCRITNGGAENAYLRVRQGRIKVEDSVFGGGRGKHFLVAEPGASLQVTGNTFHDAADLKSALLAEKAELVFTGNQVMLGRGNSVLDIRSPRFARINDNVFSLKGQWAVHLADTKDAPAGAVAVTGNFIRGSKQVIKLDLPSGKKVVDRDNLYVD